MMNSSIYPSKKLISVSSVAEVEKQDDPVARIITKIGGEKLQEFQVPSLLKSTFNDAITDSDLKIVLFYLPRKSFGGIYNIIFNE